MVRRLRLRWHGALALVLVAGALAAGCTERTLSDPSPAEPEAIDEDVSIEDFGGDARTETTIVMRSIVAIGDVDGDGRDDLALIEAVFGTEAETAVHVLYGRGERLEEEFDRDEISILLHLPVPPDGAGPVVEALGDLDADGVDEIAVKSGHHQVFRGLRQRRERSASDAWFAIECESESAFAQLGPVGDVDGDGIADFAITDETRLWLFPGAVFAQGIALDCRRDGVLVIDGDSQLGRLAGVPGDFDGDGFDDILVESDDHQALIRYGGPQLSSSLAFDVRIVGEPGMNLAGIGLPEGADRPTLLLSTAPSNWEGHRKSAPLRLLDAGSPRVVGLHDAAAVGRPLSTEDYCAHTWAGDLDADGLGEIVALQASGCALPEGHDAIAVWYGARPWGTDPRPPDGKIMMASSDHRVSDIVHVGDFDGDGFSDLAVLEDTWYPNASSRVRIIYGARR